MREIKFRALAKRPDVNWVYGDVHFGVDDLKAHIHTEKGRSFSTFVDPETIGQFTGLKDKNGVEIYIGDIYKWYQPLIKDRKQIRKEHLTVVLDEIPELFFLNNRAEGCWGGVEIIGNIHENPEAMSSN